MSKLLLTKVGSLGLDSGNVVSKSPDSVAGLELWLKADAITPVPDGTALATWPDSSGNSRDVIQVSGTQQPLYKTNILNGLPVVRFDGVNDTMTNILYTPNASAHTILIAYNNYSGNGSFYSTNDGNGPLQRSTAIWYQGSAPTIAVTSLGTRKLLTLLFNYGTDNYSVRQNGVAGASGSSAVSLVGTTFNLGLSLIHI